MKQSKKSENKSNLDYSTIVRYLKSCKTEDQLSICRKMVDRYRLVYPNKSENWSSLILLCAFPIKTEYSKETHYNNTTYSRRRRRDTKSNNSREDITVTNSAISFFCNTKY